LAVIVGSAAGAVVLLPIIIAVSVFMCRKGSEQRQEASIDSRHGSEPIVSVSLPTHEDEGYEVPSVTYTSLNY
jgi:hypothetical protein